jgi:Ca2+-binding EF-hand superfamily protein
MKLLCPESKRLSAEEALNHPWFAKEILSKATLS